MPGDEQIPVRRTWVWIAGIGVVGLVALTWLALRLASDTHEAAEEVRTDASPVAGPQEGSQDAAPEAAVDAQPPRRRGRRLTAQELRALQRRHRQMIDFCYEREARGGVWLARKRTEVTVHLKDGGRVERINLQPSSPPHLEACLRRVIRAWRFPRTLRAQAVTFTIVFASTN